LLDYETLQKTKIFGETTVEARNDVIAKKLLAHCFKISSGRPEDWTVCKGVRKGGFGVKPPLELDILRRLYYLHKGD